MIAQSKSESGRTAAVVVSVLQRIHGEIPHCQALILTKTVEAARKVRERQSNGCKSIIKYFIVVLQF